MDWNARATVVREMRARLEELRQYRREDEAVWEMHSQAATHYGTLLSRIYPADYCVAYEELKAEEPHDLTPILEFLRADPLFYGSGYEKEWLLRKLKNYPLTPKNKDALRAIILQRVDSNEQVRREFRYYVRLARVLDSLEFRAALEKRSGWRVRAVQSILEMLK
jgi:hypothetical protein